MTTLHRSQQTCAGGKTNDNISHRVSLVGVFPVPNVFPENNWFQGLQVFLGGESIIFLSAQELFSICSSPRFMHHLTYIHHTHYELRLRTWKQTEPSSAPQTWAGWQSPNRTDCEPREIRGGGKEGDEEDVCRDGEMCWSGSGLRRELMEKMFQSGLNAEQIPSLKLWYRSLPLKEYSTLNLKMNSPSSCSEPEWVSFFFWT